MNKKIVRSPVFVMENTEQGVYEINETGEYIINVCQVDCWWEGSKYCDLVRKVPIRITEQVYKIGMELPGNVLIGLTTECIYDEEPEIGLWLDEHGQVQYTDDNQPIYGMFYYAPDSLYLSTGIMNWDDRIETFKHNKYGNTNNNV